MCEKLPPGGVCDPALSSDVTAIYYFNGPAKRCDPCEITKVPDSNCLLCDVHEDSCYECATDFMLAKDGDTGNNKCVAKPVERILLEALGV